MDRRKSMQELNQIRKDVNDLKDVIYGDEHNKGMNEKIHEMYEMFTQAKGIRWFLTTLVLVGAALGAMKMWFFNK